MQVAEFNATDFIAVFTAISTERLIENNIFPRQHYNGDPIIYFEEVPIFMRDEASLLMGVPRLHQFRIHPDFELFSSSFTSQVFARF